MTRLIFAWALGLALGQARADVAQPLSPLASAQSVSPLAASSLSPSAEAEPDYEFATITVRASKPAMGARYTASEEQLKKQNLANVEDTFKYIPNVFVRKRYIGDANGVLQLRGTGMWQTGRTQVLADGYLPMSFHLQSRFNGAPRWNLVSPSEVLSTEVDFGPFNAQYGGSSMGGVVNFVTRQPQKREITLRTDYFVEDYKEYGSQGPFQGYKAGFSYAERFGRFSSFLFVDHLQNQSHPQTYHATTITAATGAQPVSNGGFKDRNSLGEERIIYGDTGPEDVTQDLYKLKLGFDGGRAFKAQATVAYNVFQRDSLKASSYLFTTSGARVWGNGNNNSLDTRVEGRSLSVRSTEFAVSTQDRQNLLTGLSFKGSFDNDVDYDLGGSWFRVLRDVTLASNLNPLDPLFDNKGRVTRFEDTGWETAYAKVGANGLLNGSLNLFGGYAGDHYQQSSHAFNSNDWRKGDNAVFNDLSAGNTLSHAGFAQGTLSVLDSLDLTLGLRQELWSTYGAVRKSATKAAPDPDRSDSRLSPKAVLAWKPAQGWEARLAGAKAYRFPIVEELYQNRFSATGTTQLANADLRPEDGFFSNFGVTRKFELGSLQVNLYREDVVDSIFFQSDQGSGISTYLNVDRVVTNGAELALLADRLFGTRFDISANAAYNDARIVENSRNKALVGNFFQRVPQWRAGGSLTRHWSDAFHTTFLGRYSSHQFNNLENNDTYNGFGSISELLVFDFSARFQATDWLDLSAGVDNLFNYQYYSAHPFPQRSYFAGAKAQF